MAKGRPVLHESVVAHLDRFLAFVEHQPNGCWFRYSRARNSGYTTITVDGRAMGAHRFSYAAYVGDIPPGMEIDHTCRDRGCVNPEHLELVTRKVNLARRDAANPGAFSARSLTERIASRTADFGASGCWTWTGALVRGYGVLSVDGRTAYVHRALYEDLKGPIPRGLDLDHSCRNPLCVNPDHLEPVTRSENVARMLDKQPKDRCRRGHRYEEVGRTGQGTCVQCYEKTRSRNSSSPYKRRTKESPTHCPQGHSYAVVGRYPSGRCRQCQANVDLARGRRGDAVLERFCSQGHDTWVAGRRGKHCRACWEEGWCVNGHDMEQSGRTPQGGCLRCRQDSVQAYAIRAAQRQICNSGHNLSVVGVNPVNGECRECAREYMRRKKGYMSTAAALVEKCRNGHPRTPENTLLVVRTKAGKESSHRECRICRAGRYQRFDAKSGPSIADG